MDPSTAWREHVDVDEPARLERLAAKLRDLQSSIAKQNSGRIDRALHAKGVAGVEAEFTVLENIPEYAKRALFAEPKTYRAYVRISNGQTRRNPDPTPDIRGMAIKLVGVAGTKIITGMEHATTQDFLGIRNPLNPFRDAEEFAWFFLVFSTTKSKLLFLARFLLRFGPVRGLKLLRLVASSVKLPLPSVATSSYFSALPIRFGDYAVRYALRPHAHNDSGEQPGTSPDYVSEELGARLRTGALAYDFRVQFFVDEARTPIEDASRGWSEADAPYVTLGRLTLLQQDLGSPRGQRLAAFIESLSFDPWHAQVELRPLGNMMRGRRVVYRLSSIERGAVPEPDGSKTFD